MQPLGLEKLDGLEGTQSAEILELLDDLRQQGRLKISGRLSQRLTYHDPCQISRRGGVIDEPRNLINMFAEDFVEMPEAGKMNWCCGAGGGVSSNERADEVRLKVFQRKKDQLDAIHVDGMTREAAMKLMIEGGFQEEREAAGKWVRAQLSSAQLSTYFVGYQEHSALQADVEAAWGDEFTLRRYHDQALSYGSPPVKYVRALMLGEPIPRRDQ